MPVRFVKAVLRVELDSESIELPAGAELLPNDHDSMYVFDVSPVNKAIIRHADAYGLISIDDSFETFREGDESGAIITMNSWYPVIYEMPDRDPIGWAMFVAEGLPATT